MKKFLLLLCLVWCSMVVMAQGCKEAGDSSRASRGLFYKTVPQKLNIKDKIFLVNKTPFPFLQSVVALVDDSDGSLISLGSSSIVAPNETWEIISYANNALKYLRGKRLAIKVKASKKMIDTNRTSVGTPYGSVGVSHVDISSEIINSLKPEDITYDFDAELYEANHDLYIHIIYKGENGIMDF